MDLVRHQRCLGAIYDPETNLRRELYLRAATVMTTRSFSGPASFNRNSEELLVARDHVGRCPVLIPGLDILNHDPSAKVSWIWDANVCALRVEEPTPSGRQVWNNYDPKSNEERRFTTFAISDAADRWSSSHHGIWF